MKHIYLDLFQQIQLHFVKVMRRNQFRKGHFHAVIVVYQRRFKYSPTNKGNNVCHDPFIAHRAGRFIQATLGEILLIQFQL